MDSASETYLEQAVERIAGALGGNLTGVYLHGSAVLGGYDARRSDLDVLVVVPQSMTKAQKIAIAKGLAEEALPCPAVGLEMSIVTEAVAANPNTTAPEFELHMTTAAADCKVVDGHGRGGDPDLVLHFAVCRAWGRNLAPPASTAAGPTAPERRAPDHVFGQVLRRLIKAQLREELRWAVLGAPRHYAVLNASRAWAFLVSGQLVGKVAGGEWALRRIEGSGGDEVGRGRRGMMEELVRAALARQRGDEAAMEADGVNSYIDEVLRILDQDGTE